MQGGGGRLTSEGFHGIYCTFKFHSARSMCYFAAPRIVLHQLFLTGKNDHGVAEGILCISTKWQASAFNHRICGVKLRSIEMYEFVALGMGCILFTSKTIPEGAFAEIEFRLRTAFPSLPSSARNSSRLIGAIRNFSSAWHLRATAARSRLIAG